MEKNVCEVCGCRLGPEDRRCPKCGCPVPQQAEKGEAGREGAQREETVKMRSGTFRLVALLVLIVSAGVGLLLLNAVVERMRYEPLISADVQLLSVETAGKSAGGFTAKEGQILLRAWVSQKNNGSQPIYPINCFFRTDEYGYAENLKEDTERLSEKQVTNQWRIPGGRADKQEYILAVEEGSKTLVLVTYSSGGRIEQSLAIK